MLLWIMLALAVYLASLFAPSLFLVARIGVGGYIGPRDSLPDPIAMHGRALRALRNMKESLFLFLPLAAISFLSPESDHQQALMGAQIFVIARLLYLPSYILGLPWVRSAIWTVGFVGIVMIGLSLM